jgi:hypothetical protein
VHRRTLVRLVRRALLLLVRGISPAATARRTGCQPAPPRVRPPRRPRAKGPQARTARAKSPPESNKRPLRRAHAVLVLGRLVRAGTRSLPGLPPVRSRPPAGDRAEPQLLRRRSKSISRGPRSSRNTSRGHRLRRNRGRPRGRRRRLSRGRCHRRRLSRGRCHRRRLSRGRCHRRRLSRGRCPPRRLSRGRCPPRRLSHDRNRRPAAKLGALLRRRSRVLHLRRPQGLPIRSRPLVPYPYGPYGIRRRLQHPSNPFGAAWGLAGRPSLPRPTRRLSLSNSNPRHPSRSRCQPHPVRRLGRLPRQVQSLRQDGKLVLRSNSARRPETSPALRPVQGPRWPLV